MSRLPLPEQRRRRQMEIKAHAEGATLKAIAEALGIGQRSVQRYIECANLPKAREFTRADVLAAYCAGEKVEHIAARFGITARTVARYAAEAKVARRRGRPNVWPDCPPSIRPAFLKLARDVGAHEARKVLERGAQR